MTDEDQERYDCHKGLTAYAQTFESLQCDIRACGGAADPKTLQSTCKPCENYITNRQERDKEELARPV